MRFLSLLLLLLLHSKVKSEDLNIVNIGILTLVIYGNQDFNVGSPCILSQEVRVKNLKYATQVTLYLRVDIFIVAPQVFQHCRQR